MWSQWFAFIAISSSPITLVMDRAEPGGSPDKRGVRGGHRSCVDPTRIPGYDESNVRRSLAIIGVLPVPLRSAIRRTTPRQKLIVVADHPPVPSPLHSNPQCSHPRIAPIGPHS